MAVKDYNVDPDLNTTIEGINIAEGCPPSGINNAIRQLMADVKVEKDEQAAKDAAQDAAIGALFEAESDHHDATVVSIDIDGLDLVLSYGNGSTERVKLPTGKGVGDLWWGHDQKSVPANVQLYSGQLLSRAAYEAHSALVLGGKRTVVTENEWQAYVAEHGFCPWFSEGDGVTTYRFPLVKGVHPKFVAALAEAGQYIEAGLPNITGSVSTSRFGYAENNSGTGALRLNKNTSTGPGYNSDTKSNTLSFDASRSNPIYGNSDTVQPPALTFLLGEYVVGSVAVVGEADAESLLEAINAKADADVGGKGVVRSINGVAADAAGNVSDVAAQSLVIDNSYVRMTNGLQICWGVATIPKDQKYTTVSLPAAFKNTNSYRSYVIGNGTDPFATSTNNTSSSAFTATMTSIAGNYGWARTVYWFAVGVWQ